MIKTTKKQIEQACEMLRNQIKSGAVSTDGKIPAVRKLAEQAGFERNTIWRALVQLKEERLVISAPNGRYQVHPRFKLNKKDSKKLKTVLVGRGDKALDSTFIQMVYNALAENQDGFNIDLQLLLENKENQLDTESLKKYDALILSTAWSLFKYKQLRELGINVTGLFAPYNFHVSSNVMVDNFNGGESAGKILSHKNIKKIVILGETHHQDQRWHEDFELRVLGFRKSWIQNGRSTKEIKEFPLPVELIKRIKRIEEIVSDHNSGTAYFALSDETGILLLSSMKEKGIKVPDDSIVLGFDDTPAAKEAELSSFHPDPGQIAEKLMLQLRTQEVDPDHSETLYVKPDFIERKSTKKDDC